MLERIAGIIREQLNLDNVEITEEIGRAHV